MVRTLALLIVLAFALAACGAQEPEAGAGAQGVAAAGTEADPAPRTIRHALGETRIEGVPKRIVALDGNQDVDALLALGLQPAAIARLDRPHVQPPYQRERLARSVRTLRSLRAEPNVEEILGLRPDLILIAEFDEKHYDELSKVAPTIAYDRDEGWEAAFGLVAQAVGRTQRAEEHVAAVEARYAPTRAIVRETGFDRLRLGLVYTYPEYLMGYGASGHPGAVLARAGVTRFVEPPGKQDAPIFGGHPFSLERLTYLRPADLLLTFDDGGEARRERRRLETDDRLWRGLPAVRAGRVDGVAAGPWYQQTALTVPLVLDELARLAREHGPG